nr:protein SMG5 [Leptinotarsa decemlineata]
MKKTYTQTDINQNQGQELSKKLYRSISEQAKRLDDARSCARNIGDLFTPNLQVQRKKFCEYCERLIFSDVILYGRKGEELLWRKSYYDVVSTAKKLKKKEYLPNEITHIQAHINAGIGFYHHMISRLQYEFNVVVTNAVDFPMSHEKKKDTGDARPEALEWSKQSIHQCLIYLGDLSRYKLEIYPNWEPSLAIRYYLQAISYKPDYGMPHNQMGTLAMNQNHSLEAVYYYMRCLSCKFSFEGTTNNLQSLFEKNSKFIEQLPEEDSNSACIIEPQQPEKIKRFLARFLLLIDIWYFNKKVAKVYNLCHQTYKNFEECLTYLKSVTSESGDTPTDGDSSETDSYFHFLTNDMIFKIVVICLLCISKLRAINSPQLSTAIAFTLAIYSQLVQNVTNHIQEGVLNYPLNENAKPKAANKIMKDLIVGRKRSRSKLRRRKAFKNESEEEESEVSDNDEDGFSSSDDSFISDDEDVLAVSSDDESDIIKVSDESNCGTPKQSPPNGLQNGFKPPAIANPSKTKEDVLRKVQLMDVNDMIEIITEETTLQSIKILNDWLRNDPEVLKSCGSNTGTLLRQMTHLLNLVNINLSGSKMIGMNLRSSEIINKEGKIPLPEDVLLKGVDMLKETHSVLDWSYTNKKSLCSKEEAVIRVVKLISFGKFLTANLETEVVYEEENNAFVCKIKETSEDVGKKSAALMEELELQETENGPFDGLSNSANGINDNSSSKGGQLTKMKHMGQLWLAAEVRALESRMGGKAALSPYLVLDADALIKYTYMVKHLVHSRKFIVLVPTAVVSALDDLKREQIEARDAIRWLESQFHRGNRFFRAQRAQERAPIPFIKYPKRKDKEMHDYIQIIECCHFLAEQQKGASNVVTLLIGNQNVLSNGENKDFSYVGLAQSVGIAIESITSFYGKWKKTKGKR